MRSTLTLLLFLALATPALASDGVLEISQTCAVETGCFIGDAAGFPVAITRSGSYRLTSNLEVTNPNSDSVQILASDVTLDLNGFSISGPTVCNGGGRLIECLPSGTGIGVREVSSGATTEDGRGIRVRNGTVRGMADDGVSLFNVATIEDLTVIGNGGDGISCVHSCTLQRNRAIRNGGTGLNGLNSSGPVPTGLSAIGNVSNGNGGLGLIGGSGAVVIGNMLKGNGGRGLQGLGGYANNVITDNTGGTVNGFTEMGGNVCNGSLTCP